MPIAISTEPPAQEKGIIAHLFDGHPTHLNAAFFYAGAPEESGWTFAHEQGRREVEKSLAASVSTSVYVLNSDDEAEAAMEKAVADGAQVLFATAPTQIDACRKIAARHPAVKVLNCSLSMSRRSTIQLSSTRSPAFFSMNAAFRSRISATPPPTVPNPRIATFFILISLFS